MRLGKNGPSLASPKSSRGCSSSPPLGHRRLVQVSSRLWELIRISPFEASPLEAGDSEIESRVRKQGQPCNLQPTCLIRFDIEYTREGEWQDPVSAISSHGAPTLYAEHSIKRVQQHKRSHELRATSRLNSVAHTSIRQQRAQQVSCVEEHSNHQRHRKLVLTKRLVLTL